MNYSNINWLAVVVSALATFVLGAVWYSPMLFAKPWMKACGFTEEDMKKKGNMGMIFGLAFVLTFFMAMHIAWLLKGPTSDIVYGMIVSGALGTTWVAFAIGILSLFERRSLAYALINGGYFVVSFLIMGAILAVWR